MATAVTNQSVLFYIRYNRYWEDGGFNSIYQRIQAIQKRADEQRLEMISSLSELLKLPDKRQFSTTRAAAWKLFRVEVKALQNVEKEDLAPIRTLLEDSDLGEAILEDAILRRDWHSMCLRTEHLQVDVDAVYKNSLYPWLLALQNVQKDWDPSGIVCKVWDYFSWRRAGNVRAEIGKVCPKRVIK